MLVQQLPCLILILDILKYYVSCFAITVRLSLLGAGVEQRFMPLVEFFQFQYFDKLSSNFPLAPYDLHKHDKEKYCQSSSDEKDENDQ
jgi:hypothetical protein